MKYGVITARVLLGLIFIAFGLNAFLHFIPMPPPTGQAGAFVGALFTSGYFNVIAVLQIVGGLAVLSGRFLPLGLTLLGPVIVNIVLFHLFMEPSGLPLAGVVSLLALFLLWARSERFAPLLQP